jgi:excinuclease ABC subunit C
MADDTVAPSTPLEKARTFPTTTGVYLMKDVDGKVIYIGKAKNLRSRASSYFSKDAATDVRIRDWIGLVRDADYIETEDGIAAMLLESRMVKDLRPRFNKDLKDDKTFPYLQNRTRE